MTLIETEETNRFTYERFAAHPFYTEVNRSLVKQALTHLPERKERLTIVDMACGTGAVTRLIAEELANQGRLDNARLIGVDPSAEALKHARTGMDEMGLETHADFIQGEAEDLPAFVQDANAAFFCNAIHLVPDKRSAFEQMSKILAVDGIFACNSAFYEGTYVPGSERFYRLWTRRAVGWLKNHHPDVHLSREAKAMAMQWVTPEGYVDLFKAAGFSSVDTSQEIATISLDAWRDLGQYWLFIEGALPNVPLAYGAEALEAAVYQTGQELGIEKVQRNWLQLVAMRGSS